jgi:hypothetical protein
MTSTIAKERRNPIHPTRRRDAATNDFIRSVSCPICNKRMFDITEQVPHPLTIRIKCSHCRRIIQISTR